MASNSGKWNFWIDRGGTFTDIVARDPCGQLIPHKLLSDNPEAYADAATQGIRYLMGVSQNSRIDASQIATVKMGTTVATNALLERKGDRVLLITNSGFADSLAIGYQARPRLFDREIIKPSQLYERVAEVDGRYLADGTIETPLDVEAVSDALKSGYEAGLRSVAIVFMHAYRFPDHEVIVAALAKSFGYTQISTSHEVSPLIKFVGRGDTTVVDAYLSPILQRYVEQVSRELETQNSDLKLMFMRSSGGLTDSSLFKGRDAILSGPAGGIVGAAETCRIAKFNKVIGFDMGGTSTDVAHFAGELEREFETEVAGVRMRVPMMKIHTVAAGGGSLLTFDGSRFRVGPESAGANPGPACYRRGGAIAVTDANMVLGKLQPKYFPAVFGSTQDKPLDAKAPLKQFEKIAAESNYSTAEEVAEGFLQIAVENMANAIKKISVQRGYNISEYALSCFGGAGGQHACAVADALGMTTIMIHPFAGILSAYGMGLADISARRQLTVEKPLTGPVINQLESSIDTLKIEAMEELNSQGISEKESHCSTRVHLKYQGTDSAIEVPYDTIGNMQAAFEKIHREQFGFVSPEATLTIETAVVNISGGGAGMIEKTYPIDSRGCNSIERTKIYSEGSWIDTEVYRRSDLAPGHHIDGPAIIVEDISTIVIEKNWSVSVNEYKHLVLRKHSIEKTKHLLDTSVDPIMLEIFNNLFMSIAEQMGVRLQNTARSTNIKERLDFSCAVFDSSGSLIANAPHTPVHLGSMDRSVESVIAAHPKMKPGDVFVTNAPYNGGTHLPDITVVTPVFNDNKTALFFVASRGHHADVGGIAPGSMTPLATSIQEEGVVLDNRILVKQGEFQEAEIRSLLESGPYPCRNPDQNLADLKAQIAANEKGVHELRAMIEQYSLDIVRAYMGHVQDYAEECVRRAIEGLQDGDATTYFDQGCRIQVAISVDKPTRSVELDFTGTSDQQADNYNAPEPVTRAAVLYVFRCMVDDDIPMNAGCMRPIKLKLPEKSMLTPECPAAVVAGNVEVSQVVTDTLFAALNAMAGAQGTMNNFNFGNNEYQYYETICGGAGAGEGFNGASAVHTHMTNTRLTDPEILELRYPVVLEQFSIRRGSGGEGRWQGGAGVSRTVRFREPMDVSFLCGRRSFAPNGLKGGSNGSIGRNLKRSINGTETELEGRVQITCDTGEAVVIETPGGGGFGAKS